MWDPEARLWGSGSKVTDSGERQTGQAQTGGQRGLVPAPSSLSQSPRRCLWGRGDLRGHAECRQCTGGHPAPLTSTPGSGLPGNSF